MKITNLAVNSRTSVFVLVAIILIQGVISYVSLPREASPDISIPLVIVSAVYPGVSPEDIETLITQPLEKEINAIGEVKEIQSSSYEGYSVIQVEFESGYEIENALQKVRDKVDKAEPDLPEEVEKPEIMEINFSEFPIINLNISGPVGLVRLKDIAEDMQDEIEKINGVLEAKISGGMEREVQVDVDLTKLQHYNVRFNDIIFAIADENKTIPGGTIDVNESSFMVRVPGEFTEPYSMEDIIIKMNEGKPIYVRDVASVTYGFKDRSSYARSNGVDAVTIAVSKRVGENVIEIANEVKKVLYEKRDRYPDNITFHVTSDFSEDIEQMVRELENNIFSGLVLVIAVLFLFLGVRNALFVAVAIPLSMLITFIILQYSGVTLNFVVLFALILALGMLVDNAIVIIENIYKFIEEGHNNIEAAKLATAEVAWPVITSTLTTLAAFSPLLFWPGITGDFMYFIPLTVIITLASSLFVALIINPVIAATFMKVERGNEKAKGIFGKLMMPLNKMTYFAVETMLPWTLDIYEKVLRFAIGPKRTPGQKIHTRNWIGLLLIIVMFVLMGVATEIGGSAAQVIFTLIFGAFIIGVFTNNRLRFMFGAFLALIVITEVYFMFDHGVEFFPDTQPERIFVNIEAPTGTNIDATNDLIMDIEQKIINSDLPDIEDVLTVVGASNNAFDMGATPNKATLTIQYVEYEDREQSSMITTDQIRKMLNEIPGIDITIDMQQAGPPVGMPVNIDIIGEDYSVLEDISTSIKEEIRDVPGLVDLDDNYDDGKPEMRVDIDREKAAYYGLNTSIVANALRTAINGFEASKYRVGEDEYDITVRLKKEQRNTTNVLENMRVIYNNKKGKTLAVPLMAVADVEQGRGPGAIRRKDMDRVITVSGDAADGYNGNDVLNVVKQRLDDFDMPPGYTIEFSGQSEEQKEASDYIAGAFMVAILLIFLILVIQFDSLSQPFIILSAVIISLNGVFIGLILFAMPFGIVMTGIGVISLAGVVVNNNIVLIDYTNQLREKGANRRDAVIRAGLRRFRPVTLTAITTVLGLIPLSFGIGFDIYSFSFSAGGESAEFWRSMGIAVIFGLTFATFLTLIVVPVIYVTIEDLPDGFRQMIRGLAWPVRALLKKQ